jgi:hypothetical protein
MFAHGQTPVTFASRRRQHVLGSQHAQEAEFSLIGPETLPDEQEEIIVNMPAEGGGVEIPVSLPPPPPPIRESSSVAVRRRSGGGGGEGTKPKRRNFVRTAFFLACILLCALVFLVALIISYAYPLSTPLSERNGVQKIHSSSSPPPPPSPPHHHRRPSSPHASPMTPSVEVEGGGGESVLGAC